MPVFQYLTNKLNDEYHHLNLWYFVSFFYGIVFYFKTLDSLYSSNSLAMSIIIAAALSVFVIFFKKREKLFLIFMFSLLLAFTLGISAASFRLASVTTQSITKPQMIGIEGTISRIKPTTNGVQVVLTDIQGVEKLQKIRVNLMAKDSRDVVSGDRLKLHAKLFPLSSSLLPGGYDFGLYMYLDGIQATGFAYNVTRLKTGENNGFYEKVENIRAIIYHKLMEVLGRYEGNFVAAILIGQTKAIDSGMAANMRNSGIAHILSVSGLHLSLVAMIFFIVSRFLLNCSNYLSYKINIKIAAGIISILGSFAYLLLSGSNIAATRAFIMTFIVILAIIFERSPYPLRSVMIAAMMILLLSPEYIMHPSFQLSFSAVLCLISGYEIYIRNQQFFGNSKGVFGWIKLYIFTNIYSSFLASIVTAPFVIYHFYKFATYSILMNLLAVPLMSFFMMPLAIIALVIMPIGLSEYPLKLLGFFVKIVTDSADYVVSLPQATISTGYISEPSMFVFTFGFFWICLWQTSWRYFGLVIITASVVMMYFSPKPDFIYDHKIKAVSINESSNISIYSKRPVSGFTKEYWLNWYGILDSKTYIRERGLNDNIFELQKSGKRATVSLNYHRCSDADVQIITSRSLNCNNNGLVVPYEQINEHGVVLVFCGENGCLAKLGQKPIWKIIKNEE